MSISGKRTPEYKVIKRLFTKLKVAVQGDLIDISDRLFSCGMISADKCTEFKDSERAFPHVRASNLVSTILSKIEMDSRYFEKFISVLNESGDYYRDILEEINSHHKEDQQPMFAQSTVSGADHLFDSEQSDSETSALIKPSGALDIQSELEQINLFLRQSELRQVSRQRRQSSGVGYRNTLCILGCIAIAVGFIWLYFTVGSCKLPYIIYFLIGITIIFSLLMGCMYILSRVCESDWEEDDIVELCPAFCCCCCLPTTVLVFVIVIGLVTLWHYLYNYLCKWSDDYELKKFLF